MLFYLKIVKGESGVRLGSPQLHLRRRPVLVVSFLLVLAVPQSKSVGMGKMGPSNYTAPTLFSGDCSPNQLISDPPNVNDLYPRILLQVFAQAADENISSAGVKETVVTPDGVKQHLFTEN